MSAAATAFHLPFPYAVSAALGGYLVILFINPVRASLRDGLRAVRRYAMLWVTIGTFGFLYALFQLGLRAYLHRVLPPAERPVFIWAREAWRDPNLWLVGSPESLWYLPGPECVRALRDAILPAIESTAGIFNSLVITFPTSALAALLLLVNWQGHHAVLGRALRKRFAGMAWAVHTAIIVCALAALAKPFIYAVPQLLKSLNAPPASHLIWFQWAPLIAWLAFLFEYLFGVCIQIYLILLAYTWVRGLTFHHANLLDLAIRRFSYVVKWAAIVMALSTLFIDAPLILKNFPAFAVYFPEEEMLATRLAQARACLATFLLLTATMQIMLTFHNESWRKAMRDHLRFIFRRWWPFGWFLLLAGIHFFLLHACDLAVRRGVGEGTALWVGWSLFFPWIAGFVAAWLLASWVCVFKRCDTTRADAGSWIKF
jgi:hypothetical protein